MEFKKLPTIKFEDAKITYRNFTGVKTEYNREGDKNFCVIIPDDKIAQQLADDGWNVKIKPPRSEDEGTFCYLPVKVNYDNIPPEIYTVTRKGTNLLTDETVKSLDKASIRSVDLEVRPYNWVTQPGTKNEKSGVAAYVKAMWVVLEESSFAEKYQKPQE